MCVVCDSNLRSLVCTYLSRTSTDTSVTSGDLSVKQMEALETHDQLPPTGV